MAKTKEQAEIDILDFENVEDPCDIETYPNVRKYRDILSKKEPIVIAFMDTYGIEYREQQYPYELVYSFKGHGHIEEEKISTETLEKIEKSQENPDSINPFIEAIANGLFILDIQDAHNVIKYATMYKEKVAELQQRTVAHHGKKHDSIQKKNVVT